MIRILLALTLAAGLALPAAAQTRYSAGVVASHERASGPGPLTGLGVTVNAQRGFVLAQATLANVSVGPVIDYWAGPGGSDVQRYRADISVGADVSGVLPIAGPLAATAGVGLGVVRLDRRYFDILSNQSAGWGAERHLSAGALVRLVL